MSTMKNACLCAIPSRKHYITYWMERKIYQKVQQAPQLQISPTVSSCRFLAQCGRMYLIMLVQKQPKTLVWHSPFLSDLYERNGSGKERSDLNQILIGQQRSLYHCCIISMAT